MIVYFIFLVFTSSFGFLDIPQLEDSVGVPCQSNGGYNITLFDVDPFPPNYNNPPSITIQGIFTQNTSVSFIVTSLKSGHNVVYQNEPVFRNFTQGQQQIFSYLAFIPKMEGNWICTTQIQSSTSNDIYACWVFQYSN